MTNLAVATPRFYELGELTDLAVKSASAIYEGSAVGITAGYARMLAAGDIFAGFCINDVAATTGDGAITVRVRRRGEIVLTITSVAVTDIGKTVYASDGNAFTLTASTNTAIGRITRVYGTNLAVVAFDAAKGGIGGGITALIDSSGGTASDTLAAITGSYVEATIENTVASLAAKINEIVARING